MKSNFEILPIFFDIEKLQSATNELFTKMSWKQHIVKGLCMTQIPGDPSSADGDKLTLNAIRMIPTKVFEERYEIEIT